MAYHPYNFVGEVLLHPVYYSQNNLLWNPYLKLLYMSWNFYRKILNILLKNLIRMGHFEVPFFLLRLFKKNLVLTPPGTYSSNARGSDTCRGSNSLWTRTLDIYTKAGLPECVVSTMPGPPPETTQRTHTQFQERNYNSWPAGNWIQVAELEGRDSTDHATVTDHFEILRIQINLKFNISETNGPIK